MAKEKEYVTKSINLDQVCKNTSNQTAMQVCTMGECVCRQIRKELPNVKRVVIRSDNAGTYRNNLIPVVLPFIFRKYGIQLDSILYSETQDGKGSADIHFATANRYVDDYIDSEALDAVTPADLVHALNHGRGLIGTIAELYEVNYAHHNSVMWKEAMAKGATKGGFASIPRSTRI